MEKRNLDFLKTDLAEETEYSGIRVLSGHETPVAVPKVFIEQTAFQKIKCFVDLCEYEINGLGVVERENNSFIIKDVFTIKQFTDDSGAYVKTDPKALNLFIYELVKSGGDASKVRFQWHSHANMPAFFSWEDVDTIGDYMNDYMISSVHNKKGQYRCRLDLFKPFHLSLEVPLFVNIPPLAPSLIQQCQKEIERNVNVVSSNIFGFSRTKPAHTETGNITESQVEARNILIGGE